MKLPIASAVLLLGFAALAPSQIKPKAFLGDADEARRLSPLRGVRRVSVKVDLQTGGGPDLPSEKAIREIVELKLRQSRIEVVPEDRARAGQTRDHIAKIALYAVKSDGATAIYFMLDLSTLALVPDAPETILPISLWTGGKFWLAPKDTADPSRAWIEEAATALCNDILKANPR